MNANRWQRERIVAGTLLDKLYSGGKDVGALLGELSALTRDLLIRRLDGYFFLCFWRGRRGGGGRRRSLNWQAAFLQS